MGIKLSCTTDGCASCGQSLDYVHTSSHLAKTCDHLTVEPDKVLTTKLFVCAGCAVTGEIIDNLSPFSSAQSLVIFNGKKQIFKWCSRALLRTWP